MTTAEATQSRDELSAIVAAATAGDESAFSELFERHRRELQVHCYRMLGSFEDSEDLAQETFLRAWRKRDGFKGRSSFRAWLYRIATNACLDAIKRRPRQPAAGSDGPEVLWLQPYPDHLLEGIASPDAEPDATVVSKETIELAFLAAIQLLPATQRAVLILRDVLDWSAKDSASLLETSVPSVNSALQRARATMKQHLPESRAEWAPGQDPSEEERALLQRYVDATERSDADALAELLREDVRFAMPPEPGVVVGRDTLMAEFEACDAFDLEQVGRRRCVVARVNMQPAVASYRARPGESEYRPEAMDVLRIEDGVVAEIVAFPGSLYVPLGLPPKL